MTRHLLLVEFFVEDMLGNLSLKVILVGQNTSEKLFEWI